MLLVLSRVKKLIQLLLKNNYTMVASDIEMDKAPIKEFGQARE